MSLKEIKSNHEKFLTEKDLIEKIRLTVLNIQIQQKAINDTIEHIKYIARLSGLEVNFNTTEVTKIK